MFNNKMSGKVKKKQTPKKQKNNKQKIKQTKQNSDHMKLYQYFVIIKYEHL